MPPTEPPALVLRPAEPSDVPALADLYVAAREAAVPAVPPLAHPPASVPGWLGGLVADDEHEVWLAEPAGPAGQPGPVEPVGLMVLTDTWLDQLYVLPGRTGEGIGSALLALARSLRPGGLGLWVFQSNERAQRFYAAHGFVEVERTDGRDNEEREPDVRMVWRAEPST